MQKYLLIALGGAVGSVARYWVGSTIGGRMGVRFPYGTLVVNITACAVIGFALTWFGERAEVSPAWRYLVAVGFIGAYSTFSTYEWETLSFILELPQYRMPTVRSLAMRLYDRAKVFVRQAGTIILAVTLVLWVGAHLPLVHTSTGVMSGPELADSLIGRMGHFIEPVIAPLGFNWKVGIGLISSVLAREVMVSTMGTLYGADPDTQSLSLQNALQHDITLGGALALMIFFAFAMQCTSTMAVVRRETNSWKWPAFQFTYMLILAYSAAFVVNHVVMALVR